MGRALAILGLLCGLTLASSAEIARADSLGVTLVPDDSSSATVQPTWQLASQKSDGDFSWSVYEQTDRSPERPAYRIETELDVPPGVAASTLMSDMAEAVDEGAGTSLGERRQVLERTDRFALVHTYIDLPLMFSDREVAIEIHHRDDARTGVHRIDWVAANERLPPPARGVVRLETDGYWEFRPHPDEAGRARATYVTRADVGGSLPRAFSNRMMRAQAVDSVKRLNALLERRRTTHVAAPPPAEAGILPVGARSRGTRSVASPIEE